MKANELQIADWVWVNKKRRQVCQVTKKKIGYHSQEYQCYMLYARLLELQPIDITPEELQLLGFKIEERCEKFVYVTHIVICEQTIEVQALAASGNWQIFVHSDIIDIKTNVSYIHEIQHILNFLRYLKRENSNNL